MEKRCARCNHLAPIQYDSGRYPIQFCRECRSYFRSLAIILGINWSGSYRFTAAAMVVQDLGNLIYRLRYNPTSHLIVTESTYLMAKIQLPLDYVARKRVKWPISRFFEEIYEVEWHTQHILDMIAIENHRLQRPLF